MALKFGKPKYRTAIAITIYLQIILWGSLIGLVVSLSSIGIASVDIVLRPAAILLFVSSFLSVFYLIFHTFTARRRRSSQYNENAALLVKRPAYILTRMTIALVMAWLITTGWNLIVAARQPICRPAGILAAYWQAGGACIAQRFGTAIAMILLIASCALFATLEISHDPLKSHLFGATRDQDPANDPITFRTASIHQRPFPRPGGLVEKWARSPNHSRSNSNSSATLRGSVRDEPDAITTRPIAPLLTGTTVGNGIEAATISPRALGEFPVSRPGTAENSPKRGLTPPRGAGSPIRGASLVSRANKSTPSLSLGLLSTSSRSPPPARLLRTSQSTTSLTGALNSHPYVKGHSRSASGSSLSLPGFNPPMPLRPPPPAVSTTDSAWRAVHPPAHQFQHVSSTVPYVPFAPKTVASGTPVTYGNVRNMPQSQGLGLGASRAQSLAGGYPGYAYHSRNHSASALGAGRPGSSRSSSSNSSNPVAAWVGTQQRSALSHMQLPSASTSNLFRGSGNEMSGALGVNPVDAMLGPPPQRAQDLDLAIKLERKLQEVQKKLERQGSARSGDSGSSYSLGEIERGISASPVRNEEGIRKEGGRVVVEVKEVGGKSFAVERGVVVLR